MIVFKFDIGNIYKRVLLYFNYILILIFFNKCTNTNTIESKYNIQIMHYKN